MADKQHITRYAKRGALRGGDGEFVQALEAGDRFGGQAGHQLRAAAVNMLLPGLQSLWGGFEHIAPVHQGDAGGLTYRIKRCVDCCIFATTDNQAFAG